MRLMLKVRDDAERGLKAGMKAGSP